MPHHDLLMSRRRLLIRQKGYQNLNIISVDAIYPRASHTRSPSFRRARGIEAPPSMPQCPVHSFGRQPQDDERHNPVQTAVDTTSNRGTGTEVFNNQIIQPSPLPSEIGAVPRKLPVAPNLNADDGSIPGATWQKAPKLSYTYTRGVDIPPNQPPNRPKPYHPTKAKAAAVSSTPRRSLLIDPTESIRYGFNSRHNVQAENESFCPSYSGSSLSSHETRWGRCHRAVRLEFPTPSIRSLNSWYSNHYMYNPQEQIEEFRRSVQSPRSEDDIKEYHQSQVMEEPDYYYEEEESHDDPEEEDCLAPALQDLEDSGSSSRGTDSSSSSSSGADLAMVDIGNGTLLRLRGAEETWRAIANDFYTPGECTCCETTLFCIQDAGTSTPRRHSYSNLLAHGRWTDYFICPGCRVICPLNDGKKSIVRGGGVGLGFTFEELSLWQQEMTANEQRPRSNQRC